MSAIDPHAAPALPRRRATRPCRRCGYHAPEDPCPHCGGAPAEPSLAGEPRVLGGLTAGATALFRGAGFLLTTPRTKRWLAPPVLLTIVAFAVATALLWRWIDGLLVNFAPEEFDLDQHLPGWIAAVLEWPVRRGLVLLAAQGLGLLGTLFVAALVWWFAFSLVFEAVAGPFLDEIHGRIEARWFGSDPRNRLERPPGSDDRLNLRASIAGAVVAALAVLLALPRLHGWDLLWLAPLGILPFALIGGLRPRYGRWLWWVATIEARALRASLAALTISGVLLVLFLPVYLVPLLGPYVYAVFAGFATSITLLDLPFSRRGLDLRDRLRFLRGHAAPLALYGLICGLLFGIPFLGPLLVVPSASIGGLWLFCRLDKTLLRERAQRGDRPPAATG